MSEQDPSGDPGATGPRDAKAEAKAAKAYAKAQRPWYKKKRWWLAGFVLLIVVISVASSGGGSDDDSSDSASDSGAPAAQEEAPQEPKPESTPASSDQEGQPPLEDGDWRLDSIRVGGDAIGDFEGSARITYTGDNPEGGTNLFTVTVFVDGKDVAALAGSADAVEPEGTETVQLISTDNFVGGPYTYDFQVDL